MARQIINIGTTPNDGTGDTVRNAFDKVNDNFDEVYNDLFVPLAGTDAGAPITGEVVFDDDVYATFNSSAGAADLLSINGNGLAIQGENSTSVLNQFGLSCTGGNTGSIIQQVYNYGDGVQTFNFPILGSTDNFIVNWPAKGGTVAMTSDINAGTVTSVDLTAGTSGTDVNVSGSPITSSGSITLNIPTASATNRGALSSADWTTFNNKQNALTNPVTGTGVSGQVAFWSGTTEQSGSNNLFWNNANGRLGIGTNTPSVRLQVNNGAVGGVIRAIGLANWTEIGTTATDIGLLRTNSVNGIEFQVNSTTIAFTAVSTGISLGPSRTIIGENNNVLNLRNPSGNIFLSTTNPARYVTFGVNNTVIASVTDNGLLINTFTDAGFRLDVNGTARVQNTLTLSPPANTTGLTLSGYSLTGANDQPAIDISGTWNTTGTPTLIRANVTNTASNANSLLMDLQVGGTSQFSISRNSSVNIGSNQFAGIYRTNDGGTITPSGRGLRFFNNISTQAESGFTFRSVNSPTSPTSGVQNNVSLDQSFSPISGTATFNQLNLNQTINQTGGANGITRGLFITPTLTAAADWRSIEWSNNTGRGLWGAGTANNAMAGALNVGSATNANASAILELTSTTRGFLPPRMTTTERNAIAAPAAGLVIYNTTDNKHQGYDGTNWNNFY